MVRLSPVGLNLLLGGSPLERGLGPERMRQGLFRRRGLDLAAPG